MAIIRGLVMLILVFGIGAVAATNLQQAYAPRDCPGCAEFKKLTHEFVAAGARLILEFTPALPPSASDQFLKLSANFERDVVLAVINDHAFPGDPVIPNLMNVYEQEVVNLINAEGIFENPPEFDEVIEKVENLKINVLCIFFRDCPPR